jgi:hypothetical protein
MKTEKKQFVLNQEDKERLFSVEELEERFETAWNEGCSSTNEGCSNDGCGGNPSCESPKVEN